MDICLQVGVFPKGILELLEWSVNEIAGNILDHAGVEAGYLQVTHFKRLQHFAFVVCDTGIGIPASMKSQFPAIVEDYSAIQQAVIKGVTSKPGRNQGLGLAGIASIARQASGYCKIQSGQGRFTIDPINSFFEVPASVFPGTVVELQFDTHQPIDVSKTLFGDELTGYLETQFEAGDEDVLDLYLTQFSMTFGNRPTGERIRAVVENVLQSKPLHRVRIHFDNVRMISSSFADELFGRLALKLGIQTFKNKIEVYRPNDLCQQLISDVLNQRIN